MPNQVQSETNQFCRGLEVDIVRIEAQPGWIALSFFPSCYNGTNAAKGRELLKQHGDQTATIDLSFVPSIEFDHVSAKAMSSSNFITVIRLQNFSDNESWASLYSLDKEVCNRYRTKFNEELDDCSQYQ